MDYSKIISVEIRDSVVTKDSLVWMHWCDDVPEQMKASSDHVWMMIVDTPLYFSVVEPEYSIDEDGDTIYNYNDPCPTWYDLED